jgi:carboxyl-terminal processing protease
MNCKRLLGLFISAALLAGCGGGGSSSPSVVDGGQNPTQPQPSASGWIEGEFEDESVFEAQCETPRSGVDQQGSYLDENNWLRAWSHRTYLWYDEIIDRDPDTAFYDELSEVQALDAEYGDVTNFFSNISAQDEIIPTDVFFHTQRTTELTQSGTAKDNYHFTYDTEVWEQLTSSGISVTYGYEFHLDNGSAPGQRVFIISYVYENSPLFGQVSRGTKILEIDGVSMANANSQAEFDVLNSGIFPSAIDETHEFLVQDAGSTETRIVTAIAKELELSTVPIHTTLDTDDGKVGYLLFTAHRFPAQAALVNAIGDLSDQNIQDLVVDLRFNGGGSLFIASQLAYMVTGDDQTSSRAFEKLTFNDKYPTTNPVTGEQLSEDPFYDVEFELLDDGRLRYTNKKLPSLNLNRIYVLTTDDTCSASESFMNGLAGIDVEVIQIGGKTCGKPYGFYATDNCGTSYFTVQFKGENDKGFGEYSDGFAPVNDPNGIGELVPGCYLEETFGPPLGDPEEGFLKAALVHRADGSCPTISTGSSIQKVVNTHSMNHFEPKDTRVAEQLFNNKLHSRH